MKEWLGSCTTEQDLPIWPTHREIEAILVSLSHAQVLIAMSGHHFQSRKLVGSRKVRSAGMPPPPDYAKHASRDSGKGRGHDWEDETASTSLLCDICDTTCCVYSVRRERRHGLGSDGAELSFQAPLEADPMRKKGRKGSLCRAPLGPWLPLSGCIWALEQALRLSGPLLDHGPKRLTPPTRTNRLTRFELRASLFRNRLKVPRLY